MEDLGLERMGLGVESKGERGADGGCDLGYTEREVGVCRGARSASKARSKARGAGHMEERPVELEARVT